MEIDPITVLSFKNSRVARDSAPSICQAASFW